MLDVCGIMNVLSVVKEYTVAVASSTASPRVLGDKSEAKEKMRDQQGTYNVTLCRVRVIFIPHRLS
jgi:hypothetical protein